MESLKDLWQAVCDYATQNLGVNEGAYTLWFKPITLKNFDGQTVTLSIDNDFLYPIIVKKYKDIINTAFNNTIGFDVDLEFILAEKEEFKEVFEKTDMVQRTLDDNFENFVVGKSNNFAYAAAKNVAENPGSQYNPLFIYGKPGLGKTHLLKAIENEMKRRNPSANIIYITCENFLNDLVFYIRQKNTQAFRDKYRNADALLIDDVQFISGKESFEDEFFNTFNDLHENGKQIVFTSDRPPNEFLNISERLEQRFTWGLTTDIQPPDYETRVAIIINKAEEENIKLSKEIIDFLAKELKNNVRQLESAIKKIKAICALDNCEPDLKIANDAIKELSNRSQPIPVLCDKIISNVSKTFGITEENIVSDKRDKDIKDARQTAMYIMREITGLTLEKIGEKFNNKTHSTVKKSIENVNLRMKNDLSYKKTIEDIIKNIQEF